MIKFTAEQIQENWNKLIQLIEDTFEGERKEKLLKMYKHFEDRMCLAPASGQEHFHLCTTGGYVQHILNIVHYSKEFYKIWKDNGAYVDDYTMEELVFAAMHHDLGKVGDLDQDYYIPNDSDWHRKNQGSIFKHNPEIEYMTVTDRALWLLQHFGVSMTQKEFIGLRLTDGMYEEANKSYYVAYQPERQLRSNIAYILHQADMLATHVEYDEWKRGELEEEQKVEKSVEKIKGAVTTEDVSEQLSEKSKDLFDELFGDK